MCYDEYAYLTRKKIHMSPKHRADSRAPGSGQHLELGMSEEGDQEPSSASGYGAWGGKQQHPAEANKTARGCAAFLSSDCKMGSSLVRTTQGSGPWHTAMISHLPQAQPPVSVQLLSSWSFNTSVNLSTGYLLSDSKGLGFPTLPTLLQPWVT